MQLHDPESAAKPPAPSDREQFVETSLLAEPVLSQRQRQSRWILCSLVGGFALVGVAGIATLIVLPQTGGCTKSAEVLTYVGTLNRAQQAYYEEKGKFSQSLPELGLGISEQTSNYQYSVGATQKAAFNFGIARQPTLYSYVGGVFIVPAKTIDPTAKAGKTTTVAICCRAIAPGPLRPLPPSLRQGVPTCGVGTNAIDSV